MFPEFPPFRFTQDMLKMFADFQCDLPKYKNRDTHWSAISCEQQKSWERRRRSGGREKQKEHTETPGVWGQMRTRGPNSHSQQQRRGDTGEKWRKSGGAGGGVKVIGLRLQLHHNVKIQTTWFCGALLLKDRQLPADTHYKRQLLKTGLKFYLPIC